MRCLALLLLTTALPAWGQVSVENAWTRATAPGARVGAGYVVIRNNSGAADRLVSVSSTAAEKVETHVTVKEGEIFRMREVSGYDIPAKGSFELKPGGAHLMFVNISTPFKEGGSIPVVLKFQNAGELKVEFNVGRLNAPSLGHKGH